MNYVGIDLHKLHTQICTVDEGGAVLDERRIRTKSECFAEVFGSTPRTRILVESCGMSEWAARLLEGHGHEVIVGDPGHALMYGARNPKMKTDVRDALALAQACRLGMFRRAHRSSDHDMGIRRELSGRRCLVAMRTQLVTLARGNLRYLGIVLPGCSSEHFAKRFAAADVPDEVREQLAPVLASLDSLNEQIEKYDESLDRRTACEPTIRLLMTVPGIGPVTAAAFSTLIGDATRFRNAHQVEAYLGLVPREYSSGEKQRRGSITKNGNGYVRSLLVQTAVRLMRMKPGAAAHLVAWAKKIASRRGNNVARVALAGRLAGILFAMMRDKAPFSAPEAREAR